MSTKRLLRPVRGPTAKIRRFVSPALVVGFIASFVGGLADTWWVVPLWLPAIAAAFSLALTLEERIWQRILHRPPWQRAFILAGTLLVAFGASWLFASLRTVLTVIGFDGGAQLILGLFVFWFMSAIVGTFIARFSERVAMTLVDDFRGRVRIVTLTLVAIVLAITGVVTFIGIDLLDAVKHDEAHWLVGSTVAALNITPEYLRNDILPWIDAPGLTALASALIALLYGVPALTSAAGKVGEAVVERIAPLAHGFDLVAQGERELHVEEGGPLEMRQISNRFNALVLSLALAERMERAFGQYVSGHVLELIRARHGDGTLPATLREASVFFADIRGFTAMSEKLAPEQVVAVLNRYFERAVAVIAEHDGYLNKFIGDAVVVVFNGPIDQPDHATRAVRCAIALEKIVDELNASDAFPELHAQALGKLQVGIGVATGPMVCGNIGSAKQMEYTVIGDTVNLAARLTSKAGPGEVWISEATTRGLDGLSVAPLEPISVKGKAEPVKPSRAWPVP